MQIDRTIGLEAQIGVAVAIATDSRGRLLTVRKRGTKYLIQPGGKIEPGENAARALSRELGEELGWEIPVSGLRALGTRFAPAANEPRQSISARLFALDPQTEPHLGHEIESIEWLHRSDAHRSDVSPLTRLLLDEYAS